MGNSCTVGVSKDKRYLSYKRCNYNIVWKITNKEFTK